MQEVSIRCGTPNDAASLSQLWRETFVDAYADVHSAEDMLSYMDRYYTEAQALDALNDHETDVLFAVKNEELFGVAIVRRSAGSYPSASPRGAELKHLYIKARAYGRAVGQRLFQAAMRAAKDRGADTLWLSVSDKNPRAQRFYQKNGFRRVDTGPTLQVGRDTLTTSVLARSFSDLLSSRPDTNGRIDQDRA